MERRKFLEEFEKEEAAKREEAMRPIREAQARFESTAKELAQFTKNAIVNGPDPDFVCPASVAGKTMSFSDARKFTAAESAKFIDSTPDYFPCQQNFQTIVDYMTRNGIQIADAATFKLAYERLREYGLLQERPAPEPEPEPAEEPEPQPEPPKSLTFDGIDLDTGEPRIYTEWELNHMTSDEMKKRLGLRMVSQYAPVHRGNFF